MACSVAFVNGNARFCKSISTSGVHVRVSVFTRLLSKVWNTAIRQCSTRADICACMTTTQQASIGKSLPEPALEPGGKLSRHVVPRPQITVTS